MKTFIAFFLFLGTAFAQHVAASKVTVTNSGTFTNTQIHQYVTSMIGGIDPNMYHAVQGFPGYTTEAGSFGVAVPSNATAKEADALVGMITSACNSASRTTCNSVAISGHAEAIASGAGVWGQNTTVSNHDAFITGVNLVGNEIDVGITGDQSGGYVHGLDIFLSNAGGATMPSNVGGTALEIGATAGQWSQGMYIMGASIQASGNALYVDPPCGIGSCDSPKITMTGYNGSPHFGSWYVDSAGNVVLSPATGAAVKYSSVTFSALPASANGTMIYCSDCKNVADNSVAAGAACVSAGQGSFAKRQNNRWDCN